MGVILNERQFDDLPRGMPEFRQRLHEWGLESEESVGTVVFAASPEEVALIVAAHPDSDFFVAQALLPAVSRLLSAPLATHDAVMVSPDYSLLLSRHALPAPAARWSCRL
jgi:hypothetical protein